MDSRSVTASPDSALSTGEAMQEANPAFWITNLKLPLISVPQYSESPVIQTPGLLVLIKSLSGVGVLSDDGHSLGAGPATSSPSHQHHRHKRHKAEHKHKHKKKKGKKSKHKHKHSSREIDVESLDG